MKLYLVYDEFRNYQVAVYANNHDDAIEKMHKWMEKSGNNGCYFNSRDVKWNADLCDNDKVLE